MTAKLSKLTNVEHPHLSSILVLKGSCCFPMGEVILIWRTGTRSPLRQIIAFLPEFQSLKCHIPPPTTFIVSMDLFSSKNIQETHEWILRSKSCTFLQWRFHLQISTSKSMGIFSIFPSTLPTSSHIPNFPRASNSTDLLAPRHSALDSSSQSPPFASIDRYLGMWFIDDGEKSNSLAKTIQYVYIYMIYVYMSIWKMSTNAQLLLFTVVYFSLLLLINTIVYYYCLYTIVNILVMFTHAHC